MIQFIYSGTMIQYNFGDPNTYTDQHSINSSTLKKYQSVETKILHVSPKHKYPR